MLTHAPGLRRLELSVGTNGIYKTHEVVRGAYNLASVNKGVRACAVDFFEHSEALWDDVSLMRCTVGTSIPQLITCDVLICRSARPRAPTVSQY